MTEKRWKVRMAAAGAALCAAGLSTPVTVQAAAAACGRACLTGVMERYLAAATGQRFAAIPVGRGLKARENAVATPLGAGVWKTLTRKRAGWTFADPAAGQVAFAGAFDNRQSGLTPLLVRLKVKGGRITESEVAYNTTPGRYFHPEELLEPDILYTTPVPPARRSSRAELIAVGHAYMDGIAAHSGAKVPMSYRCDKYYLGGKVTNNGPNSVGDCLTSFNGVRADPPADRRTPVVDVENGVVLVTFLMPNAYKDKPDSTFEMELIKVVDGKIRSVEEFGNVAAYPPSSGFGADPRPASTTTTGP